MIVATCQHENRKKNGTTKAGATRYRCKNCGKSWTESTAALSGMRVGIDTAAKVIELLDARDARDIVVFGGGIIPEGDIAPLQEMGVARVFTPGTKTQEIVDWVNGHRLDSIVTVGICTDICVLDFVATMLSVRNHGLTPTLEDVVVYEPGCSTYDLPLAATKELGLPPTAAHPQAPTHHIGLYVMAGRGAVLASELG